MDDSVNFYTHAFNHISVDIL